MLMHGLELPLMGKMRLAGVSDAAMARYRDSALASARRQLDELAARSGLPADRLTLVTPSDADAWMLILQTQQAHDCDLIVIGRHGRHVRDEALLGSTTRMVLAESHADVLVSVQREAGPR